MTHQSALTSILDFFLLSEVATMWQTDSAVYKLKPRLFYKSTYLWVHSVDFHPGVNQAWQRSSGSWFNWKKWQNYIRLSMWLRKQEGKRRKRPGRKVRGKGLQRKRRGKKDPRLWDPNTKRLTPETRRGNSPPRRLKKGNQKSTIEML